MGRSEDGGEMMDDLISRHAVLDIVDSYSESLSNVEDVTQDIISDILALPSVQPIQKTGHWIDCSNGWMCSECNNDNTFDTNYCPNCGCHMIDPQESEVSK